MPVTLIADDLTGACDAGALFAGRGRVGVFVDAPIRGTWEIAAIDTETRELPATSAAERTRAAVAQIATRASAGVLFKKIDSTLRGAIGAELDAVLDASGARRALVCPALPGQGRIVVEGELLVDGVPCHRSPTARDASFTSRTSDVSAIVAEHGARDARRVTLREARGSQRFLREVIARMEDAYVVADAETDADLDALATAALAVPGTLLAGSAGLARAVAAGLGHLGETVPVPEGRAWLIVIGSLHPASRHQLRSLVEAGIGGAAVGDRSSDLGHVLERLRDGQPAYLTTPAAAEGGSAERRRIASALASAVRLVLAQCRPDLVVVTGGDTAHAVLAGLAADHLAVRGAPGNGLALADVVTEDASTLTWLTKAGGFGAPGLWLSLLKGAAR